MILTVVLTRINARETKRATMATPASQDRAVGA